MADLEVRLLLEAIFDRYHYDFRSYADGLAEAPPGAGAATAWAWPRSRACRSACCTSRECFTMLLQYLTVQVSDMFRDPEFFLRAAHAGAAGARDLSIDQGLGARAAAPAKRPTRSPSCCRRKACSTVRSSTPPTSTRRRCARPRPGVYRARAPARLHRESPALGRPAARCPTTTIAASGESAIIDAGAAPQDHVLRSQPGHRQCVLRSAPGHLPQRAHLLRSRAAEPRAAAVRARR